MIFHEFQYESADQAQEWVKSQLTIYAKIEKPVLAFVIKILEPFIGQLVDPRISKAQGVVKQVSESLVQDPHGTYGRIAESNELTPEDLKVLGELMGRSEQGSRISHPHGGWSLRTGQRSPPGRAPHTAPGQAASTDLFAM